MPVVREVFDGEVVGTVTIKQVADRISVENRYFANRNGQAGYDRGLKDAGEMDYVTISLNNVWGGRAGGGSVQSYERIGYHSGSVDWLLAMVTEQCPVYCAWDTGNGYEWRRVELGC